MRGNSYTLDWFMDTTGRDRLLRTLRQKHVMEWVASMNLAPSTIGTRLGHVRGFSQWAVLMGHTKTDFTLGIKTPPRPRSLPRELAPESVTKALIDADARLTVTILLRVSSGLRRAEVCRLEIGDIDRARREAFVVGKGGHERIVPLSLETLAAIDAYLAQHPAASGPLIRSYSSGRALHPDSLTRLTTDNLKDSGVKTRNWDGVNGHAYRHTAAGALLDEGADLRDLMDFLGHSNLATTSIYTKRRGSSRRLQQHVDARRYGV